MKTNKLLAIVIAIVAIYNSNFCMEQQDDQNQAITQLLCIREDRNYEELKNVLKQTAVNSYNTIEPRLQYNMLKICITLNNLQCLYLCLKYSINPNRYRKELSLLHYAVQWNKYDAIKLLAATNADLVPLHNIQDKHLYGRHNFTIFRTPLEYAYDLKHQQCIDVLLDAINERLNKLAVAKIHCGLIKHITKPGPCDQCIAELDEQLKSYKHHSTIPYITNDSISASTDGDSVSHS